MTIGPNRALPNRLLFIEIRARPIRLVSLHVFVLCPARDRYPQEMSST